MSPSLDQIAQESYRDEISDHRTYQALAQNEKRRDLRELLSRVAAVELSHVRFWQSVLTKRNLPIPADTAASPRRIAWMRLLQKVINPVLMVTALELGESRAVKRYHECLTDPSLDDDEKETLRSIIVDELEHEVIFRTESEKLGLSNVRDLVLGMNDGVVEILGAVTGLSAVYSDRPLIVAASGLIVGVAGALSMGIGAFISVRSQRQVREAAAERVEILFDVSPERAVAEYRDRLTKTGVPREMADEVAQKVGENRDAVARLLLPESHENEIRSGIATGLAYLLGVAFPVLPYFLADAAWIALIASVALAGLALAATAGLVSVLSGISLRRKIIEMLVAAFSAATLAYVLGAILHGTIDF